MPIAIEFRRRSCCRVISSANKELTLTAALQESAASRGTMIFRREVIGQFYCELFLSLEIAKVEAIAVGPVKRETSESIVI